jgi:hypothetical protein
MGCGFSATPPPGVTVTYALVPKARLSEAVKGEREALEIEAAWRKVMMAKPHYPFNLINERYSIVVFVEHPASSGLIVGQIGLPIQFPRNPVIVNVSLAVGYNGTYVIDGGGLVLLKIPFEPKPYEWLEFHSE